MEFKIDMRGVNKNNRSYPSEVIDEAVEEFKKKHLMCGRLGVSTKQEFDLTQVSHKITSIHSKDGIIEGEYELLQTENGVVAEAIIDDLTLVPNGTGKINVNDEDVCEISDYKIISFDLILKKNSALNES